MRERAVIDPAEIEEWRPRTAPSHKRYDRLREAIDALPRHVRDVINATFWERLSGEDAARALGISAATVDRDLALGLRLLREEIEADPALFAEAMSQED